MPGELLVPADCSTNYIRQIFYRINGKVWGIRMGYGKLILDSQFSGLFGLVSQEQKYNPLPDNIGIGYNWATTVHKSCTTQEHMDAITKAAKAFGTMPKGECYLCLEGNTFLMKDEEGNKFAWQTAKNSVTLKVNAHIYSSECPRYKWDTVYLSEDGTFVLNKDILLDILKDFPADTPHSRMEKAINATEWRTP